MSHIAVTPGSRPRRLVTGLAAVLAVALVTFGCGDSESEEDRAKATVTGFLEDVATGNGDAGCARLAGDAVRALSAAAFLLQAPASCPEAVKLVSEQLSDDEKKAYRSAKVKRLTIAGNQATVADDDIELDFKGQATLFRNNNPMPVQLEKSGEDWKISSLG